LARRKSAILTYQPAAGAPSVVNEAPPLKAALKMQLLHKAKELNEAHATVKRLTAEIAQLEAQAGA